MPSFSAKVYSQMDIKRESDHEIIYSLIKDNKDKIYNLVKSGHQIGEPRPIFREISDEEMLNWKKKSVESPVKNQTIDSVAVEEGSDADIEDLENLFIEV